MPTNVHDNRQSATLCAGVSQRDRAKKSMLGLWTCAGSRVPVSR